ncbi:sensor histidine kinase [Zunongwangia atlantica]|uniref:histidine kinase n=1 Tax=Zunongwangia atlantica 22II14-10F7 TaxID=1185767 RepID=A0A1Y1T8B1_9FLAO|nr:ATP-binding protein [Zunongwangia atlantica]ORL46952.1 two-component system sensor histidine kinase [Zunongwangia atlantica 22II14-10F7]
MLLKEEVLLIAYVIFVCFCLGTFIIAFFVTYQRRKNKLLREKIEAEQYYEKEISNTKIEIQEQTLKNIGWELHDNIGQLLSVAKMQLNMASAAHKIEQETLVDIKNVVANSLQEVRALSKSLNSDVIGSAGLEKSVQTELDRFSRLNVIKTNFTTNGKIFVVDQKDSLVIFRILQEFFSNVIKHSGADHLKVCFEYLENELFIICEDDGVGFDIEKVDRSNGLFNMQNRSHLINSQFKLESFPGRGTSISLHYPKQPSQSNE